MPNEQTTVPLFVASEVLTAADMNLSAGTGVPVFSNTTTRDAGFGGAGEKVLAEGQLCYLSDSNIVQYYSGASWLTVGPATAGALVRVGGGALSGTSTAFTSVFSATYDAYKIIVSAATFSGSGNATMILGATATGYYYSTAQATFADNTYSGGGGAGSNAASWFVGGGNTSTTAITLELNNPFLAARSTFSSPYLNGGGTTAAGTINGMLNNTTSYTGFTISVSSGNLTGTCNIYGYSLS